MSQALGSLSAAPRPPFVIFALPRSRTAWLSRFLTYGDWMCGHDEAVKCRGMEDIKSWLSQPNTGTVETAAAPWWRTVLKLHPETRIVVVRRPVADVLCSLAKLGLASAAITADMHRLDHKLAQIARRTGALTVSFDELATEEACARVFEHCLPYRHDSGWWHHVAPQNTQISMPAMMRYMRAHFPQIERLAAQARVWTLADLAKKPHYEPDDLVIREEPLADVLRDGGKLMREHCAVVGETPDAFREKNWDVMAWLEQYDAHQVVTARCNGKLAGYLMTTIGPSLESPDIKMACHAMFYASPDFKGVGRSILKASTDILRAKGVDEVFLRAGPRGDGPRLASVFRRMGAEDSGQLFRMYLDKD